MSEENLPQIKKIYARALDPIHIGAGGYTLGRVDNTIIRDPATNVPKIPGTSIAGVIKAFAEIVRDNAKKSDDTSNPLYKDFDELFGTDKKKAILRFYDGQILFFPVYSTKGTIWITTKEILQEWFSENVDTIKTLEKLDENKIYALKGLNSNENSNDNAHLNLGWLFFAVVYPENQINISLPNEIDSLLTRIVLVSDKLFSHIVNDNLEIRTSVRIDSTTGAAVDGALFTYEAIPRGTIIGFEIGIDTKRNNYKEINNTINALINAVKPYFKLIGIGGKGTRGFGRIEILNENSHETNSKEE